MKWKKEYLKCVDIETLKTRKELYRQCIVIISQHNMYLFIYLFIYDLFNDAIKRLNSLIHTREWKGAATL